MTEMSREQFYEQLRRANPWLPEIERVSMDRLTLSWETGAFPVLSLELIVEVPPGGFTLT